jgi:hypothetical protein
VKRIMFALLLIAFAVVVAIWRLPASAIIAMLPDSVAQKMSQQVSIHEVNGTLWNGNARFTVSAIPPTLRVSWQCAPNMLKLAIECTLTDSITGSLAASLPSQSLALSDLKVAVPIRLNVANTGMFESELVNVSVSAALLSSSQTAITAGLSAVNAVTTTGSTSFALGEISLDCAPMDKSDKADSSRCTLRNRASDNRVDGQIDVSAAKATGAITFTPAGGSQQRFSF